MTQGTFLKLFLIHLVEKNLNGIHPDETDFHLTVLVFGISFDLSRCLSLDNARAISSRPQSGRCIQIL